MLPDEFRSSAHQVTDWVADFLRDIRDYPVLPRVKPGEFTASLPATGPEQGEAIEQILQDFRRLVVPGVTHWNHPRFFAYFSISASGPGLLGEMLCSALNCNHMLWSTGPSPTELEQVTLGWLRQWLGLPPQFFGIIHDTATTSIMHAMLAAREAASPRTRLTGAFPALCSYQSEHANFAVDKAALTVGVGRNNIRKVPCDAQFRMNSKMLDAYIEEDLAMGKKPFCVVATVGTTSTGSIDPLRAIADVCHEYGVWLHVDAAYAGPAAVLDEYRRIMDGAEFADSISVNPHKWLFTPLDLSILYIRHPEIMRRVFSLDETPAYIETNDSGVNLEEYALPIGRRFRALKLWFVLRAYGRQGIAAILRAQMQMARNFASWVQADPRFELAAPVQFSLVCFRTKGSNEANRALLDRINATGNAFLSGTTLNGRFALRLAIGNIATTEQDVLETWELIRSLVD